MTVALIIVSPPSIVRVMADVPDELQLPNGDRVQGIDSTPWTSQDGTYQLVPVAPFAPPTGQVAVGSPTYSLAGGVVTETYSTAAAPPDSWPPIKIIKALQSIGKPTADLFINKMSDSDRSLFISATSVSETSPLLIAALAEPGVNVTMSDLKAAIAALTGNGTA